MNETVQEVERLLEETEDLPPALEASIKILLTVVKLLSDRAGLNSRNSSKPPASDPNREKKPHSQSNNPRGGQLGHVGSNLKPIEEPDEIKHISIDRRTLPHGHYTECGYESRQLFDIHI